MKLYILRFSARCSVQNQFTLMVSIYLRHSTGFVRLVFFTSSRAMEFLAVYLIFIQFLLSKRALKFALNSHYTRSFVLMWVYLSALIMDSISSKFSSMNILMLSFPDSLSLMMTRLFTPVVIVSLIGSMKFIFRK